MRFRFVLGMAVLGFAPGVFASDEHNYVGAERCGSCHPFALEMWKKGPHAKAHESLSIKEQKDAKCNTCHAMLPTSTEARFIGIQCEKCHGPGRYYHPEYVMKDKELARLVGLVDPSADHCQQCHTEGTPSVEPFDFKKMWARINHGKEAREIWESRQATR